MANFHQDEITFGIQFQDLQFSRSLIRGLDSSEADGIPVEQDYDSIGGGYYPDYTVFPMYLQPVLLATDPDETGMIGPANVDVRINKNLANMQWTVKEAGEDDIVITNTTGDYTVVTTGDNLGRLTISRNIVPGRPLTFIFDADYLDPRSGDVYKLHMAHTISCGVTMEQPMLTVDIPSYYQYNPIEATDKTVHATIISGQSPVPVAQCRCKWQLRDHDSWVDFDGTRPDMLFAKVSEDTLSLDIKMDCMGRDETFRCLAYVGADAQEVTDRVSVGESFGSRTFRIVRTIPQFTAKIEDTPRFIPKNQEVIFPRAVANFRNYSGGTDPEKMARLQKVVKTTWETARGTAGVNGSTPTYAQVAEGFQPTIKADKVSQLYGQKLRLKIEDRGPYNLLTDGSGSILTDGQGNPLIGL